MDAMIPITVIGFEKIKDELKRLKNIERPAVIKEIATARALGDLSENAEWHAAREKQSFIEGRIQELEGKLARIEVIPQGQGKSEKVVFGSTVILRDTDEDDEKRYRIVGDLEADLKTQAISISSPLANSLIHKKKGEFVAVQLPRGEKEYEIMDVYFE
jgi:transcription elongation factor GreA